MAVEVAGFSISRHKDRDQVEVRCTLCDYSALVPYRGLETFSSIRRTIEDHMSRCVPYYVVAEKEVG